MPGPLVCLLLVPDVSVLDVDESLIPLLSDVRPESLDGFLTVLVADVTVLEVAVTVVVDWLSLELNAGGVEVVVADIFLLSSLNCSCCFEEKERQ